MQPTTTYIHERFCMWPSKGPFFIWHFLNMLHSKWISLCGPQPIVQPIKGSSMNMTLRTPVVSLLRIWGVPLGSEKLLLLKANQDLWFVEYAVLLTPGHIRIYWRGFARHLNQGWAEIRAKYLWLRYVSEAWLMSLWSTVRTLTWRETSMQHSDGYYCCSPVEELENEESLLLSCVALCQRTVQMQKLTWSYLLCL